MYTESFPRGHSCWLISNFTTWYKGWISEHGHTKAHSAYSLSVSPVIVPVRFHFCQPFPPFPCQSVSCHSCPSVFRTDLAVCSVPCHSCQFLCILYPVPCHLFSVSCQLTLNIFLCILFPVIPVSCCMPYFNCCIPCSVIPFTGSVPWSLHSCKLFPVITVSCCIPCSLSFLSPFPWHSFQMLFILLPVISVTCSLSCL